jgi:hypothetical protein
VPIRQRLDPADEFVERFADTVIPSAIPTDAFIEWDDIEAAIDSYEAQIDALEDLRDVSESAFIDGVADALMAADDTREWIDFYFELLGHSDTKYAALEGLWKFYPIQRAIDDGDRAAAEDIAGVLQDIGLQYLVDITDDVAAHFRGMKVGMETHRRKNRQGACFEAVVFEHLETIRDDLHDAGHEVKLVSEYTTAYQDDSGQSKVVDFAFVEDGTTRLVVEANCYKSGGSKPSEVKRSYDRVSTRMRNDGVECVWITDGQAWQKSLQNVLREGYADIIDVYNIAMVESELGDDILNYFENGPVGSEAELDVRSQHGLDDY